MSFQEKRSLSLARQVSRAGIRSDAGVEMTSMVDVTFLLLIFFMVTASFTLRRAIAMPTSSLPSTVAQPQDEWSQPDVTIEIDARGTFLVVAHSWDQQILGKQSLVSALKQTSAESSQIQPTLMIVVHEDSRLQTLVDAIDAGTIAGYVNQQIEQVDFIR